MELGAVPDVVTKFPWVEVTAVAGALAWLPYLLTLFRRPKVKLIVSGNVEIGFTGMGVIFNPTLAFLSQYKEALVTDVWCEVRHERGRAARFRVSQLVETSAFSQSTTGEAAIHQRTTSAIGIVLMPTVISERKLCCREGDRRAEYDRLMLEYQAAVRRLQVPDLSAWQDAALQSAEAHTFGEFLDNEFLWQPGNYTVKCEAEIAELRGRATLEFSFALNEGQIAFLRQNAAGLEWEARRIVAETHGERNPGAYPWRWIYPETRTGR